MVEAVKSYPWVDTYVVVVLGGIPKIPYTENTGIFYQTIPWYFLSNRFKGIDFQIYWLCHCAMREAWHQVLEFNKVMCWWFRCDYKTSLTVKLWRPRAMVVSKMHL